MTWAARRLLLPFGTAWVITGSVTIVVQSITDPSMNSTLLIWSTLTNPTLLIWLGLPLALVPTLWSHRQVDEVQLLRSGSWSARHRRRLGRTFVAATAVMLLSVATWTFTAVGVSALSGATMVVATPEVALLFGMQAALLVCSVTVLRGVALAVADLGGRVAAGTTVVLIWVWIWTSERGIVPPIPPWSGLMFIDVRVGASSTGSALSLALVLAALLILGWLAMAFRDNGDDAGRPRLRPVHAVTAGVVLVVAATLAGGRFDEPFWVVMATIFGLSAIGPVAGLVTLGIYLLLPAVAQAELIQLRSAGWYPILMRRGSTLAWFTRSLLRWVAPIVLYVGSLLVAIWATYYLVGARDFSEPPMGWMATLASYAVGGCAGLMLAVLLAHLSAMFLRSDSAGIVGLAGVAVIALTTSMAPAGMPRLIPDLAQAAATGGSLSATGATVVLAIASVVAAIALAARWRPIS